MQRAPGLVVLGQRPTAGGAVGAGDQGNTKGRRRVPGLEALGQEDRHLQISISGNHGLSNGELTDRHLRARRHGAPGQEPRASGAIADPAGDGGEGVCAARQLVPPGRWQVLELVLVVSWCWR